MNITILKPDEMAKELRENKTFFLQQVKKTKKFPMLRVGRTLRFVKEIVVPYWSVKKNYDCLQTGWSMPSPLLEIGKRDIKSFRYFR